MRARRRFKEAAARRMILHNLLPARRGYRKYIAASLRQSGKFALIRLPNRDKSAWMRPTVAPWCGQFIRAGNQLRHYALVTLYAALVFPGPAHAQLMLPGALQAQPSPAEKTAPSAAPKKPKPVGLKPPAEATILGRELSRNGAAGSIAFQAGPEHQLEITKLSLPGESISHPAEECLVDVVGDGPIQTRFVGRPKGASRYEVEIKACPFSLDVLDGAVLITRTQGTCDFPAAECRVNLAGLWGPAGNAIGPDQTKQLERERSRAETNMRANFRALLSSAGKDKEAIKEIAREQAGFSSEREMTCRNYLSEDAHGFCALRITQARALALEAAFEELPKKNPNAKSAQALSQAGRAKVKPATALKMKAKANPGLQSSPPPEPEAMPK
jgi:hypothetical protein